MKVLGLFIAIYCSAFSVAANNGKGHTHSNGQGHESHGQGNGNGHDPNFTGAQCTYEDGRPNIVMFVADDFGRWGEDIMDDVIPNIIRMGSEGVILDNSYVLPTSSPTRSALLTGYMPHRTGMQFHTIYPSEGYGLPINFEILPQKLKELCYTTYAIGKWHLGFCADEYLPQNRGFDKFYGTYTSGVDYFDKTSSDALTGQSAYDLHQNDKTVKANNNKYLSEQCLNKATDLISEHDTANPLFMYYAFQLTGSPLQAPQEKLDKYNDENPERRAFKAMASVMDDAIQSVVDALQEKGMLDNTYIVFLSDNGGEVTQGGNNWQLRGNKGTLYEGAMRTPAFVWAKPGTDLMATGGEVADGFMHAVDWFPTILSIAGGINDDVNMDGKDQSVMLLNDVSVHLRTEFLYALDESMDAANKRAYRFGDFKLIEGEPSYMYPVRINDDTDDVFVLPYGAVSPVITNYSPIIPVPGEPVPQPAPAPSVPQTLLYNVKNDPTEQNNLAGNFRVYVLILSSKINMERIKGVESLKLNETAWNKDVALYNEMIAGGVWMPGWCSAISL